MPNWCVGTLRVRGKQKDLQNFVLNGLKERKEGSFMIQMYALKRMMILFRPLPSMRNSHGLSVPMNY